MFCTKCGAEIENGAKFCTSCGQRVEDAPAATPAATPLEAPAPDAVPVQETAPAEKKDVLGDLLAQAKALFATVAAKIKPALKKVDEKAGAVLGNKKNYAYAGVLAVIGLIITIAVIAAIIPNDNGYLTYDVASELGAFDDQIYLIREGKAIAIKTDAESASGTKSSIDGNVIVFLYDNCLYQVKGKKAVVVAEDVTEYSLSLYGDAVVYTTVDGLDTTYSYCKLGGKPVEFFTNEIDAILTSYALSPDGKSVAFTATDGLDSDLYFFNGKKAEKISGCDGSVIGMSNGGKYIYAAVVDEDLSGTTLYVYNKKGNKEKIDSCSASRFFLNLDATEIMFFDDGRTYISSKGKEAIKAASAEISLARPNYVTTHKASSSAYYYPVESLYDHVYVADTTVYYVSKKESKNVKLVSADSSRFTLDDSAEFLYYMDDETLMCLEISKGEKAKSKAKEIAEEVEYYVVTSDRKYLYYTSEDTAYVVNGKKGGKPKAISGDEVEPGLIITADDTVYFCEDGVIYASKARAKGKEVIETEDGELLGGYLYFLDDDTMYVARGTRKPKKLLTID